MEGSSNSSFIPKRNPGRPRRTAAKQVYLFTIVSYIVFLATLVAAIGVFIYDRYVDGQVEAEVKSLSEEIARFNEVDMDRVKEFNLRLQKADSRIDNSVSLGSIFTALEKSTIETVWLKDLQLDRSKDQGFTLVASLETGSFDSSLFQREVYAQNGSIEAVQIAEIDIQDNQDSDNAGGQSKSFISLSAVLNVPLSAAPYSPQTEEVQVFEESLPVDTSSSTGPVGSGGAVVEDGEVLELGDDVNETGL